VYEENRAVSMGNKSLEKARKLKFLDIQETVTDQNIGRG
jgi:hypothetical protein